MTLVKHSGGCHCGRVRFEVQAPAHVEVSDCDCSMCSRTGYLHLVVPAAQFRLLSGDDVLTTYQFNTKTDGKNWEKQYPSGRGEY